MTVVHNARTSGPTYPHETAPLGSDGVCLSTHTESAATVVAATGEIDASNIDRLTDYIRSALSGDRPLVIDLSELSFFGAQGIPALFSLGEECGKAGVEWAVVASHPVRRLLRIGDKDNRLPAVGSVPEALKRLATPTPARRLLQLVTKSG
jgi:anti-anti-sigma factor